MKDFTTRVRANEYVSKLPYRDNRDAYREDSNRLQAEFYADAKRYVIAQGVPEQYASKVVSHAWDSGHSCGYSEVLCHLDNLIEVFI